MKHRCAALALATVTVVQAQTSFEMSGYINDIPIAQRMTADVGRMVGADRDQILNLTRLRLRPMLILSERAMLSVEYEITAVYHSSAMAFEIQGGQNNRQVVNLSWQPLTEPRITVMHFVDRLHFRYAAEDVDITVGRQRIAWGTGRIWNPTDLFNPLNPTAFAKQEKDGVDAAAAKITFGEFTDLTLVTNPQRGWHKNNAGFRFRTNFRQVDCSLVGGAFDDRAVVGGDFATSVLNAGVRGEVLFSASSGSLQSSFTKYIVGVDYQFSPTFYALSEYHFNGEGATDPASYDFVRLFKGEILNLARDYIAALGSYQIHPLVMLTATSIGNLDDGSGFVGLQCAYSASDECTLSLGGQFFYGATGDEYNYYPASLYVRAEFFF